MMHLQQRKKKQNRKMETIVFLSIQILSIVTFFVIIYSGRYDRRSFILTGIVVEVVDFT